jgi:O-antigen ligase
LTAGEAGVGAAGTGFRPWIEIAALGSLAGLFAIISLYDPQGIDVLAVAFFLLASLLIDQRDIDAAAWTGRRPFVFAVGLLLLALPLVSNACSANGFHAQVGSGMYEAAAPAALFLAASQARFQRVGRRGIQRLILAGIFVGLVPAAIYGLVVIRGQGMPFALLGQPATNICSIYLSVVGAITLILAAPLERRWRILAYLVTLVLLVLGLMTESRTFLVSTAVALGVYAISIWRHQALRRELMAIAGAAVVVLLASLAAFPSGLTRLLSRPQFGFFDGRLQTWSDAWTLFRRYPLCGIGSHTFYSEQLNPLYAERTRLGISYVPFYHAHNFLLNTLAEGGLILGVLLVVLVAAAIYGCSLILRRDPEDRFGWIAVALMALFLAVGSFENTLVRPVVFPLAIFLGLGLNMTWRPPKVRPDLP